MSGLIPRFTATAALGATLAVAGCSGVDAGMPREATQPPASLGVGRHSTEILVYKSPTCGCCTAWTEHLAASGFRVTTQDVHDLTEIKQTAGVPRDLGSCHTALVDGYVIEGHVPADLIHELLEDRPDIAGLAVPGMPMGSPGMEGPRKDAYEVVAFDPEGNRSVYARR